jgi:hypothetical protein
VESKIEKGLLYAGTDKGAFWVTKNDGTSWEENSTGLANNYIRSICPSRFAKARVYVAMTGINYDDLQSYLYVSEDYGKNWTSIAAGLPNEPVNVILEDPTDENILYAGGLRGVYISTNKGKTWAYLGKNIPSAAVADLEIHEGTMDLVVATHGRGIYKINLRPIHAMVSKNLALDKDHMFDIPESQRPWFSSHSGEPIYQTLEKTSIPFWLRNAKPVTFSLKDKDNKVVWTTTVQGQKGFNEYRWDLVVKREKSNLPYFVHYDKFLGIGTYTLTLSDGKTELEQSFIVKDGVSPFKR